MKIFQKGFNYSQDGDGNRLVYHLQGCNMKCPWCANPEGMVPAGVMIADEEWLLESICPYHAIKDKQVDRTICSLCRDKECITRHKTKGMYLSYEEVPAEEVVQEALSNAMMFYDGGGVTFTGGEATLQLEELKKVLQGLKEHAIHTALETNGTNQGLLTFFPYIDQLIIDCKLCDSQKHEKYTGIPNERIMQNIRKAAEIHSCIHIRVPLIGGVNDSQKDRMDFLTFFREIKGDNVTFEVLPYHEFGKKKWAQCGWEYQMTKAAYVKEEVLEELKEAIIGMGACYKQT